MGHGEETWALSQGFASEHVNDMSFPPAPRITALQRAWLQEIGIEKRLLPGSPLVPVPVPVVPRPADAVERTPALQRPATSNPGTAGSTHGGQNINRGQEPTRGQDRGQEVTRSQEVIKLSEADRAREAPRAARKTADGATLPEGLDALVQRVQQCDACNLHGSRTQAVFGAGPVDSPQWMLVGEAPGERDDRLGLPFQGKAGELLQAMFAAIGVDIATQGYSTNLVKCRPRGNRMPQADEIEACRHFLEQQLALVRPRRILALGRLAALALVGGDISFEESRGKVHHYLTADGQKLPLVVTYHPASLLSRPMQKAAAWRDLNLALRAVHE